MTAPAIPDGGYVRPTYDALPNMGAKATGTYVYASGYTPNVRPGTNHDDVFVFSLNETSGELSLKGRVPGMGAGPSFAASYDKKFMYVAAESASRLNALKIEEHGGLTLLNSVSSMGMVATNPAYPATRVERVNSMGMRVPAAGANPVYVKLHKSGKFVLTANYYGDVAVYPRMDDGKVADPKVYYTGRNTHSANLHPTKDLVYVTNTHHSGVLTNSFSIFNLDPATGVLTPHPTQARFDQRPFLLVRHTAFHPAGNVLYGIGEASDTVATFKVAADGSLTAANEYFALPMGESDQLNRITGAEIVYSNGFVYASLRGSARDATKTRIVIYKVDAADPSKLTLVGHEETRGDHARGFSIDETGKWLVVANQWTSDVPGERNLDGNLGVFAIGADGKLTYKTSFKSPLEDLAPATVVFVKY